VRRLLAAAAALGLLGCPQERPGVEKQIPPQRVPPAMALDPAPPGAPQQRPEQPPRPEPAQPAQPQR